MICVFDIETIPDVNLIRELDNLQGDDKEVSLQKLQKQLQETQTSFLPLPYHKIVSISAVIADDFGQFIKVSSIKGSNEEELIKEFVGFIDAKNPKLVSYNGRAFDMPLVMLRAMKYNLSCKSYFEKENYLYDKTKWDNYRYRFSDRFHVDLMDHISEFGAVRSLNLDTVCTLVGLPGKYEVSGSDVMELYYDNRLDKINDYCQSDVLNTYWLFLKYELLKANITQNEYLSLLDVLLDKIPKDKDYSEIFTKKIKTELGVDL